MRVELKRRFDITVAQQRLHRLRVRLSADEERCQAVTQVMKTEPAWVILYQLTFFVPVR